MSEIKHSIKHVRDIYAPLVREVDADITKRIGEIRSLIDMQSFLKCQLTVLELYVPKPESATTEEEEEEEIEVEIEEGDTSEESYWVFRFILTAVLLYILCILSSRADFGTFVKDEDRSL